MSDAATRKSMVKYFPMGIIMSYGSCNPVTMHDVDGDMFRSYYAFLGEVMMVSSDEGQDSTALSRSTKECIGREASEHNSCPLCMTAHEVMHQAANSAEYEERKSAGDFFDQQSASERTSSMFECCGDIEERHRQALDYAVNVQEATHGNGDVPSSSDATLDFPLLTAKHRVEVALIVLLAEHQCRAAAVILGTEMSTAMAGIPRVLARKMEAKSMMAVINKRIMSPLLKASFRKSACPKPGFTKDLFKDQKKQKFSPLPPHLKGAATAGLERARAVARLVVLIDTIYEKSLKQHISKSIMVLVDNLTDIRILSKETLLEPSFLKEKLGVLSNENERTIAKSMLFTSTDPGRLFQTPDWHSLLEAVDGKRNARLIVIWWSLRLSLKRAKGLD